MREHSFKAGDRIEQVIIERVLMTGTVIWAGHRDYVIVKPDDEENRRSINCGQLRHANALERLATEI
jgi:hypothetical protein